jgi:uncharacterized protein (UPF0262 family)
MGDRTTCTLHLAGLLNEAHLNEIAKIIQDDLGEVSGDKKYASIAEALRAGEDCYTFYDVNYAEMPADLHQACEEARLSFTWSWDSGSEYSSGLIVYDPFRKEMREFATVNDSVMIELEKARDLAYVSEIEKWVEFTNIRGFETYKSNHELVKLQGAKKDIDKRFFQAALGQQVETA